jgi:hypothetical protein
VGTQKKIKKNGSILTNPPPFRTKKLAKAVGFGMSKSEVFDLPVLYIAANAAF